MSSQVNIRLPADIRKLAEQYAKRHGYKNIQELTKNALREKIMEDETFTDKEIKLIEVLIEKTLSKKKLVSKKELERALR